jgi:hypothetical protein
MEYGTSKGSTSMYRANGHNGEVRASNRVPLPDRSISAEEARDGEGYGLADFVRASRPVLSGWQVRANIENPCRRRWARSVAVLDAILAEYQVHDSPSAPSGSGIGCGGRRDDSRMGKKAENRGAGWKISTPLTSGATGTRERTPVLGILTGTTRHRTRTTTSVLAASVTTLSIGSGIAPAYQADHKTCGQPASSSFGKHTQRSVRARSSAISKRADSKDAA